MSFIFLVIWVRLIVFLGIWYPKAIKWAVRPKATIHLNFLNHHLLFNIHFSIRLHWPNHILTQAEFFLVWAACCHYRQHFSSRQQYLFFKRSFADDQFNLFTDRCLTWPHLCLCELKGIGWAHIFIAFKRGHASANQRLFWRFPHGTS